MKAIMAVMGIILIAIGIGLIVEYFENHTKEPTTIDWGESHGFEGWIQLPLPGQAPGEITERYDLGLRSDGVVVWRQVHIEGSGEHETTQFYHFPYGP